VHSNDKGSTLIPVLAAVLILTVMLTALMSVSAREITDMKRTTTFTGQLDDLRGALQAVYNEFQKQWAALAPDGQVTDVGTAQRDLGSMQNMMQGWCDATFQGSGIQASILTADNNNSQNAYSLSVADQLSQNYQIKLVSTKGGVKQTLTDTITISGAVQALNYAVYAPGNVFITGAPEIDGRVAAGDSIYLDSTPWESYVNPYSRDNDSKSFLRLAGNPLYFWPEPDWLEPVVLPNFGDNSGIAASNGIYSFSRFTDQQPIPFLKDIIPWAGTQQFGNANAVADKSPGPIPSTEMGSYVTGTYTASTPIPQLPTDYIKQVVDHARVSIDDQAKNVGNTPYGQWKKDGKLLGWVHLENGKVDCTVTTQNVPGALYIDGNMTIPQGQTLTLNGPLYVAGNLDVEGVLNTSAAVYVEGTATIGNMAPDKVGVQPNRLELFCKSDIQLAFKTYLGRTASNPTTIHAFLASNTNVYIEGMDSFYKIIGGVSGQNVILNATVGIHQMSWYLLLQALDPADKARRLTIQHDDSYIQNPLPGMPTMGTLNVQALPLPLVITS
jgi:type II secretory pathway pseudopilin PulG